jgi:branched-chain amino acid transport system permease protein
VWGRAFEAVALDRFAAGVVGVNLRKTGALAFAASGAIAGLAGLLQSPLTSASYLMGLPLAIKGFSALVIGGMGRVEGAYFGGMLLALIEKLVLRYAPIPSGFAIGVPLLLLILFLLLRPTGLLPARAVR